MSWVRSVIRHVRSVSGQDGHWTDNVELEDVILSPKCPRQPAMLGSIVSVVFLVGPGGVGKTSVGPLVAGLIDFPFIDLDGRFAEAHGPVTTYVNEFGYRAYCDANATVAERIANDAQGGIILASSSGFLAHDGCDDIVDRNVALIRRTGVSIFLLPAKDLDDAARVIAFRQVQRYPDRDLVAEYSIAQNRCGRYLASSDHVVMADGTSDEVAHRVIEVLAARVEADMAGSGNTP